MKTGKLAKRLRRELTANPKKAVLLGLLLAVACYFWSPLLVSRLKGQAGATADIVAAATPADATPADNSMVRQESKAIYRWQQLVQAMDDDAWMLPAVSAPGSRDPFAALGARSTAAAWPGRVAAKAVAATAAAMQGLLDWTAELKPETVAQERRPEVTPEAAGLVLSSTLIGPRRRAALINGKSYVQGSTVKAADGRQDVAFRLAEVDRGSALLERDGKRYLLKMPTPRLLGAKD